MATMTQTKKHEITPYKERVDSVRKLVDKMMPQIRQALPRHLDAGRMARVFLTSVQKVPRLLECTLVSLAGCLIQAAQLGLEPDGLLGQGYLIPFKNNKKGGIYECQFMPSYRGLMKLARQSGEISTIYARAVYKEDAFDFVCGLDEKLEHRPSDADDPGPLVAVYAVAKFKDGGYQFEVMTRQQVDRIRARSRSANDGPWVTDYDAMAIKTVLKRLCKFLPGSVEKDTAVALIEKAEVGEGQVFENVLELPPEEEAQQEQLEPAPANAIDKVVANEKKKGMAVTGPSGDLVKDGELVREPGSDDDK